MPLCALKLFGLITPLMMPCPDAPRPRLGLMKKVFLTSIAALLLATGTAYAFDPPIPDGAPEACAKGNQEACALVTLAVEACAEGNQEACALMKQRKHGRVQKSTLPPECHFIKWRNMTKLYSCNGEIYDADQVRAMRAKTKGRNR